MTHPIRAAVIHVWKRCDNEEKGAAYIARFHPYNTYPIFAEGKTPIEAMDKLEVIRAEAIDKHEKQVIQRIELAKAAKAAREKKAKEESK